MKKGDCSAPDGTSAGGHWNPTNVPHGTWGEGEFHLGDIGNVTVSEDGTGRIELTTTFGRWAPALTLILLEEVSLSMRAPTILPRNLRAMLAHELVVERLSWRTSPDVTLRLVVGRFIAPFH